MKTPDSQSGLSTLFALLITSLITLMVYTSMDSAIYTKKSQRDSVSNREINALYVRLQKIMTTTWSCTASLGGSNYNLPITLKDPINADTAIAAQGLSLDRFWTLSQVVIKNVAPVAGSTGVYTGDLDLQFTKDMRLQAGNPFFDKPISNIQFAASDTGVISVCYPSSTSLTVAAAACASTGGTWNATQPIGQQCNFNSGARTPASGASPTPTPSTAVNGGSTPDPVNVCDPLNGAKIAGNPALQTQGLVSKLQYLTTAQPRCTNVACMTETGLLSNSTIYLSSVNVPTRDFTEGFTGANGSLLSDDQGNPLLEYFSLSMDSQITLNALNAPGNYQFALLADDGAVLSLGLGNGMEVVVNDDGTHATTMACATKPVSLTPGKRIPMHIDYMQGPRYQIALMLLWRPWTSSARFNPNDPQCGRSGNYQFFNPDNVPSTPQQAYNDLLARGWSPLVPSNFVLPEAAGSNPCTTPNPISKEGNS